MRLELKKYVSYTSQASAVDQKILEMQGSGIEQGASSEGFKSGIRAGGLAIAQNGEHRVAVFSTCELGETWLAEFEDLQELIACIPMKSECCRECPGKHITEEDMVKISLADPDNTLGLL